MPTEQDLANLADIQERLRQTREQAWDEGYSAGVAMKPFDSRTHAKNPYRKAN